jgi:hypothetical protein
VGEGEQKMERKAKAVFREEKGTKEELGERKKRSYKKRRNFKEKLEEVTSRKVILCGMSTSVLIVSNVKYFISKILYIIFLHAILI